MDDAILIRLLNVAQDIHDALDRVEANAPEGVDTSNRPATPAFIAHLRQFGECPPLPPFGQSLEDAHGPAEAIEDIVLDLMGVPADNSDQFDQPINGDEPDPPGLFCRDWCYEQIFVARESRRFKQAIARIRTAMRSDWKR
jgi:hypothetical protein